MLKWKHIRPQNVVYQKNTLWKVAPVQYRSTSSIHREESDHLPGRRMGPQSIISCIGEDHKQMEGCCDIGGPKYPWPAINREMKSSRVRLSPGCHYVIELGDYPRIIVLMRHHKWLQMVSLYEKHGISKPWVHGKGREIIVQLPMKISIPAANIPRDGVVGEVRSPDDGPQGQVWGSGNTLIRWRGRGPRPR